MTSDRLAPPAPSADELAAFNTWKAAQLAADGLAGGAAVSSESPASTVAPAPADPAPAEPAVDSTPADPPAFKVGQIVDTAAGVAVVISTTPVNRVVPVVDAQGNETGSVTKSVPGYRLAYLPNTIDSHATEQELGLKDL